jgi:hypothetical protein
MPVFCHFSARLGAPLAFCVVIATQSLPAFATETSESRWLGSASYQQAHDQAVDLVNHAMSLLGVRYRWGGNTPETGLDCSGLVRLVYAETVGRILPRRAVEMSREGESVSRSDLKPGDLVFFNTLRRAFSHVGIYVGDGKFVHAPSRGKTVRVESMNSSYWVKRFNGARRVVDFESRSIALAVVNQAPQTVSFIAFDDDDDDEATSPEALEEALAAQRADADDSAAMLLVGAAVEASDPPARTAEPVSLETRSGL